MHSGFDFAVRTKNAESKVKNKKKIPELLSSNTLIKIFSESCKQVNIAIF